MTKGCYGEGRRCGGDVWGKPQVKVPTPDNGWMDERKVVIEILKKGQGTEREVVVRSGSRGRSGSLSMGSARFFFKRGVSPSACGAMCVFAFEEYQECEIQAWCVIPWEIPVSQCLGINEGVGV